MRAKILIVEDEQDIIDVLVLYMEREGITCDWINSGEEALIKIKNNSYDLIVLDLNLPGMDGFETLREIKRSISTPVILLSARKMDADMILGFGSGADDYVTKPFSPNVLIARIRAHLRRDNSQEKLHIIEFGPFTLNISHNILKKDGVIINISPREMDLLIFLATTPGKTYNQEEIYSKIWGNSYGDLSTVSVHIRRLRKKIELDYSHPLYIKTRYGFGYYFSTGVDSV